MIKGSIGKEIGGTKVSMKETGIVRKELLYINKGLRVLYYRLKNF